MVQGLLKVEAENNHELKDQINHVLTYADLFAKKSV